jgi:hypothetical protein
MKCGTWVLLPLPVSPCEQRQREDKFSDRQADTMMLAIEGHDKALHCACLHKKHAGLGRGESRDDFRTLAPGG